MPRARTSEQLLMGDCAHAGTLITAPMGQLYILTADHCFVGKPKKFKSAAEHTLQHSVYSTYRVLVRVSGESVGQGGAPIHEERVDI